MALHKDKKSRERILVIGPYGTGKTKAWADIAKKLPDGQYVYVADTDRTVERFDEEYAFTNVRSAETTDWESVTEFLKKIIPEGTADDWLVIDSSDKPWEYVQNWYSYQKTGAEVSDRWMAQDKRGHIFADTDWQGINAQFAKGFLNPLANWPGHVFLCTPSDQIQREGRFADKNDVLEIYGRYGVKPRGNKHVPHLVHTILLTSQSGDNWKLSTIKDRGRKQLSQAPYGDFVATYLIMAAGWKL